MSESPITLEIFMDARQAIAFEYFLKQIDGDTLRKHAKPTDHQAVAVALLAVRDALRQAGFANRDTSPARSRKISKHSPEAETE
jgi:hypothetical protein